MIYKASVKRDMTYTREMMRLIDDAMRWGDWAQVARHANELSAVWGTISYRAQLRSEGADDD